MKKLLICLYLFFVVISFTFSQNFTKDGQIIKLDELYYDIDLTSDIKFKDGSFIIRDYDKGNKDNNFIVFSKNVILKNDSKISFLITEDKEKYLILANSDLFILYEKNNRKPKIFATNLGKGSELIDFIDPKTIKASSELKEGNYTYSASNISNLNISEPWVEGVEGNGISQEIQFKGNCTYIYILNGYVSFDKPFLYEANSRLKKISISFPEEKNKESIIFELKDTPNPQKIDLGFRCNSLIKLKILEVYEGTKYQDTCLSGIVMKVF